MRLLCCSPDEEDEELLERAKANRLKRLAQQKETTRDFLREEGLKDKQLDSDLIPVQKAVFQLAKSGEQVQCCSMPVAACSTRAGCLVVCRTGPDALPPAEPLTGTYIAIRHVPNGNSEAGWQGSRSWQQHSTQWLVSFGTM